VEGALKSVPGAVTANVNLATERAMVQFDPERVKLADLVTAVRDVGYDVAMEKITLPIGGMTCASCVSHVEKARRCGVGVVSATINLGTEIATVE